jgi:hypothetical protein
VSPKTYFDGAWLRCSHLAALHAYLENHVADIVQTDELLRAEWAARVSALDLYVHELVAQNMLAIFGGLRPVSAAFRRFKISNETMQRIRDGSSVSDATAAFELEVRTQIGLRAFQYPDDIAEAIRLISDIELWNDIALHLGATQLTKNKEAKLLKAALSAIVDRRNKIVHEGDLQPVTPRTIWPISRSDLATVEAEILKIVTAIDAVT